MADRIADRLAEALISQRLLNKEDLDRALLLQRERGGALSDLLVQMKLVEPRALAAVLSRTMQIPVISLSKMTLDRELAERIPSKLAFHYQMVPVSVIGNQMTVAMADPLNVLALDHLSQVTGFLLAPLISTADEVQDALHRLYGGTVKETLKQIEREAGSLQLISENGSTTLESAEHLVHLTREGPVVRLTNALLTEGVEMKASDILVEPFEKKLRIRFRVDGIFREWESPPPAMHAGIVSRLKVMATLNIAEHRLPQDGRIRFSVQDRDVDFRVSVIPTHYGEKICLRILDKAQAMLDIERLGFDPEPMKALQDAATRPHGMILITGPTGSGKTTTMYSLLKLVDRPDRNLVTVEDPVEYDLPGINQVSIRPEVGLTFAAGLRSILRQDPDVIMVGEIRDEETADIAVKAALTGHLVLSTLHTNDAIGAVARLINMGVEPYLIASCLLLVGAQRLPRRVCKRCRKLVHPSLEVTERLGLPADGQYARGIGCKECRGTGLAGRVGLLEAVPLVGSLRRAVEAGETAAKLHLLAREAGIFSLRDYAVAKAAAGVIPLEEVARTTVGNQES